MESNIETYNSIVVGVIVEKRISSKDRNDITVCAIVETNTAYSSSFTMGTKK